RPLRQAAPPVAGCLEWIEGLLYFVTLGKFASRMDPCVSVRRDASLTTEVLIAAAISRTRPQEVSVKPTYESTNHADDLVDYNLFASNAALVDALAREGAPAAHERLRQLGDRFGRRAMFAL